MGREWDSKSAKLREKDRNALKKHVNVDAKYSSIQRYEEDRPHARLASCASSIWRDLANFTGFLREMVRVTVDPGRALRGTVGAIFCVLLTQHLA